MYIQSRCTLSGIRIIHLRSAAPRKACNIARVHHLGYALGERKRRKEQIGQVSEREREREKEIHRARAVSWFRPIGLLYDAPHPSLTSERERESRSRARARIDRDPPSPLEK